MVAKVSVLMPCYKTEEKYLREAIESILSQTFTDFEFLILDDCPEDTREKIVNSYQDKRIKYLKNEKNLGISKTRNKLLNLAEGEYLAIFDHDDISLPQRLEKQVQYLDEHPEVGVVSSQILNIPDNKESHNPIEDTDIKLALVEKSVIPHPASMIRKSVLTNNNISYEPEFAVAEDYRLWCRLIAVTQFHTLPDILFHYRKHKSNTSLIQYKKMESYSGKFRAMFKRDYPELYEEYKTKVKYINRYTLLGVPLLKTERKRNRTTVFLFGILPIIKIKHQTKL